jgi:hypothetical protein
MKITPTVGLKPAAWFKAPLTRRKTTMAKFKASLTRRKPQRIQQVYGKEK